MHFGGGHAAAIPTAGISRPPKSRFFKTDQTPLELGKCLGLGKGKGLGTGKHRHKGKGKDTGQVGRITHSRRRAKRGGGYTQIDHYMDIVTIALTLFKIICSMQNSRRQVVVGSSTKNKICQRFDG